MRLSYTIAGHGAGASTVEDAEHAARVVDRALRAALAQHDATAVAQVLTQSMAPLRMAMITEGAREVESGREWSGHSAVLVVTLSP